MSRRLELARTLLAIAKTGTPIRHARAVVVSSNIGQSTITIDGGATNITAFNYGHVTSLPAGTVVDTLLVGKKAYVIGAYNPTPVFTRAWRTGAWTTLNGDGLFTFDNASDTNYNTTSGTYTCPTAGRYRVYAQIGYATTASGQYEQAHILHGATVTSTGNIGWSVATAQSVWSQVLDEIVCAAGDTLLIHRNENVAGNAGTASSQLVYATFSRIA